ncbi:MAG: helix-turn-helix transcriptional regulator [bacterium]|nr:helix-turn-helix transcriptional regulator [bacterium]
MRMVNSLSELLRAVREARNWTVQDLSGRCQVPLSVLLDVEHGEIPDADTLRALAEGLGVRLIDLDRLRAGEPIPVSEATQTLDDLVAGEPPVPEEERPLTILEALRGLNPSQIEKVMDYITLLKLAEKGRRRAARP